MTLIVASMYLPYKPQFELDSIEGIAQYLLKYNGITVDDTAPGANGTRPVVSPVATPFEEKNLSQDSLLINTDQFKRERSSSALSKLLSSEQLMESLTANAPVPAGVSSAYHTNNNSSEDLFGKHSSLSVDRTASPPYSLPPQPVHTHGYEDPTSDLLKSVNKSLLKSPVPLRGRAPGSRRLNSSLKYTAYSAEQPDTSPVQSLVDHELDSDNKSIVQEDMYNVPSFGGISNLDANLKARILNTSHELFRNLPWSIVPNDVKGNGSLKNAVNGYVYNPADGSGEVTALHENTVWVGTLGIATDEIPQDTLAGIAETLGDQFSSRPVITDDETFRGSYKNYCKHILWPTLHYQIPDNPNSKAFEDHSWSFYQKLNQQFADKIVETYNDGDTIWVNDYHLMLVPRLVRDKLPQAKIGFFLHISFPSSEVFRCLSHRERILDGLLGATFIGFQTREYLKHFTQTCNRLLMADTTDDDCEIEYKGSFTKIDSIPIGIDALDLQLRIYKNKNVQELREKIRNRWGDILLIVSRDQLDTIRGLVQKLTAYEKFLTDYPQFIGKVSLIQVCITTSTDNNMKKQITIITDRINELAMSVGETPPIVFQYKDLPYEEYLALSCEADLFWVNSQREGMNLTCHEFIAASLEHNAPLLLSEFTGSASELYDGSFLINPWDIKKVSETIKKALSLSDLEKRTNWKKLLRTIIEYDSSNWVKKNLGSIDTAWNSNKERSILYKLNVPALLENYNDSGKRLFIVKLGLPPLPRTISVLNDLASQKGNIVFVLNSFSKAVLDVLYSRAPHVSLMAENGAYVKLEDTWYSMVDQIDWKAEVIKIFKDKMERLPGSYYKIGDSLVKFHTENAVDRDRVKSTIGDTIININTMFQDMEVHAYLHNDVIYVQQTGLSLQALDFVLNYYNSIDPNDDDDDNKHSVGNNILKMITKKLAPESQKKDADDKTETTNKTQVPVEFVLAAGSSSQILDPLFNEINKRNTNGEFKYAHTVTAGNGPASTFAKEHVSGLNELLATFSKLSSS
ncbi:hypothetical protein DAKH74_036020 [Maudiozyma humilis]|uniref:Uncharacterized protein n=1 Tax=Maudiozyma humilis TaxID=51915 RepID=A0AAV5RZV4_MAUHU|nr:hypothetical protein DAKH74_036020 [Kazachstania humilis]